MKRVIGIIGLAVVAVLLMGGAICTQCAGPQAVAMGDANRPEIGAGEMLDSCIPPHPFDLPTRWPAPC
jgi:hypothetical protein